MRLYGNITKSIAQGLTKNKKLKLLDLTGNMIVK